MFYLWMILLVVVNSFWLMAVLVGLPGNWLVIISTLVAAWRFPGAFSVPVLVAMVIIAVAGELIEFLGGLTGAKRAGAGFRGSLGALGGGILGALIGTAALPVVGTLIGGCLGAGIGAWGMELSGGKSGEQLKRVGVNAGIGYLLGTTAKFICGVIIWLMVAIAAFWP